MSGERYPRGCIVIYAKAPVAGRVKSRLARDLGAGPAAAVYRRIAAGVVETVSRAGLAPLRLEVAPHAGHPVLRRWARQGARLRRQPPGGLGQRMQRTVAQGLRRADWVLIVGADCAGLSLRHLQQACAALAAGRLAVFTPAEDGGYALVGLRLAPPRLFAGIVWGGPRVMAQTRQRLRRLGLDWLETEPAWDVDELRDLRRLRRQGRIRPWLR